VADDEFEDEALAGWAMELARTEASDDGQRRRIRERAGSDWLLVQHAADYIERSERSPEAAAVVARLRIVARDIVEAS
jgi:hypothetical protein